MNTSDYEFIKSFEERVKNTIDKYELIKKNDKVLVACSGGKDSTTTLYLLNKFGYSPEALTIDLEIGEYSKKNLDNIKLFCSENNIKLHVISFKEIFGYSMCYIRSVLNSKYGFSSCHVCGILRRYVLNRISREMNFDRIATGHNLDDEAESVFMNFIQGNIDFCAGLGPITGWVNDKKFVPRIKPLYFCLERDVIKYSKLMKFPVVYDPCPCSVNAFRLSIKEILDKIEKQNPQIKRNILDSMMLLMPFLKEQNKAAEEMRYCSICGEPSRKEICNACDLIKKIRCDV